MNYEFEFLESHINHLTHLPMITWAFIGMNIYVQNLIVFNGI
jgi:hypothetical protein